MGITTCRRSCLAILTMFSMTAAMASGDATSSSRRSYQEPGYPEVIVDSDKASGGGTVSAGPDYFPDGYFAPNSEVPYSEGAISRSCAADYEGCKDGCSSCDLCPCWTVRAGGVYLRRSSATAIPIVAGVPSYNSRDLGFDYETGPMLTLIRHGILQSDYDLEMTYFGIDSYGSTVTTTDVNTLFTTPIAVFGGVIPGRTHYDSDIDSAEFNLRRQWNHWLTLMGGIRWINLNETLNTDVGGALNHRIDVDNQMLGLQLGLDTYLWSYGRFSLEGYGKAGIYSNDSDARTTTVGIGLPVVTASEDQAAFVGELALTAVYDISQRWSLRGGYQMLWLDGVALAPEQLDNMNIGTGVATVDVGQTAFYHGVNLAAEFRW